MKRLVWPAILVVCCGLAGLSFGIDVSAGLDAKAVATSGHEFEWTATSTVGLPDAYTVYSKDGGAFYITRVFAGTAETVSTYVRANESILIPAPAAAYSSGTFTQTFYVSAHTDSVFCLPWKE